MPLSVLFNDIPLPLGVLALGKEEKSLARCEMIAPMGFFVATFNSNFKRRRI